MTKMVRRSARTRPTAARASGNLDLAAAAWPASEVRRQSALRYDELRRLLPAHFLNLLDGALDEVALNGVDKWIGGVHLGAENVWRWDGEEVRRA